MLNGQRTSEKAYLQFRSVLSPWGDGVAVPPLRVEPFGASSPLRMISSDTLCEEKRDFLVSLGSPMGGGWCCGEHHWGVQGASDHRGWGSLLAVVCGRDVVSIHRNPWRERPSASTDMVTESPVSGQRDLGLVFALPLARFVALG